MQSLWLGSQRGCTCCYSEGFEDAWRWAKCKFLHLSWKIKFLLIFEITKISWFNKYWEWLVGQYLDIPPELPLYVDIAYKVNEGMETHK